MLKGSGYPLARRGCPGNRTGVLCLDRNPLNIVMRGLDPRIYRGSGARREGVDGRIKSDQVGHDDLKLHRSLRIRIHIHGEFPRTTLRVRGNDEKRGER